jgi:hypothetical protein
LPTQGLSVFLDASALNVSSGSPVSTWGDGSGLGNHATGFGAVYAATGINGVPAVEFDGVDDYFTLPAGFADFTAGATIFVVAAPTQLNHGFKLVALGNGPGTDNVVLGRAGSTSGLQYFTNDSNNAVGWFNTGSGLTTNTASVYGVHQPGGAVNSSVTAFVSINGTTVGSGSVYVPRVTSRGVNYIGKSYWSEGYFQGRIAEVVIYSRQLSSGERTGVQTHLANKYGL